jgi:hypothetical protein
MSDGNVFGLLGEDVENDPLFADPALETPEAAPDDAPQAQETPSGDAETTAPEATEPVEQPVSDPALAPSVGQVSQPVETPESGGAETSAPEPKLWAGKYQTPEALEQGYRERSEMHRRAAERASQFEAQQQAIAQKAQEMEKALRRAVPFIQDLQRENQALKQRPQLDQFGNVVETPQATVPPVDPRQVEQYVNTRTQAEVSRLRQELEAQMQEQSQLEARKVSIMKFYEDHPEVEIRGPIDSDIRETLQDFSDAWGDWEPDVANPEVLEIAYEASKDPALRAVLRKNPQFIDDEDGMKLARFEAAILRGEPITQTVSQVPASVVGTRKPVVEKASTTSPSPSSNAPLDPWEEAVKEYRKSEKSSFGDSVFK